MFQLQWLIFSSSIYTVVQYNNYYMYITCDSTFDLYDDQHYTIIIKKLELQKLE